MIDPYKTLGLTKSATEDEIKKAYRDLAKKYHPDLNPGNKETEEKFKEINDAYSMIGTKEAREKFDKGEFYDEQFGENYRSGPFYNDFQDGGGRYTYYYQGDADDLFSSLFSEFGNMRGEFNIPGQDHYYKLNIDLEDAVLGAEREIMLPDGKRLKVKIPKGIEEGAKLKFKGMGGPGRGNGKQGDAYVEILIKSSKTFRRVGDNLEIEIPITLDEAVNGSKIKIPTIDGNVMLTIPPGVNTGTKLRVKNKGMPNQSGKDRGDQIVKIKVILPDNVDQEFKDFIRNWTKDHSYNPRTI
ncbi:MAG: J domain-containing protein [Spirochaetota bacterium]|nr:J domain-containing protein [Spirochaetota bacterium]